MYNYKAEQIDRTVYVITTDTAERDIDPHKSKQPRERNNKVDKALNVYNYTLVKSTLSQKRPFFMGTRGDHPHRRR